MNQSLIATLFSLISLACTNESLESADYAWDNYRVRGNVKSISELSYAAVERFGEIERGDRARESYFDHDFFVSFNKNGDEIEKLEYGSDGALVAERKYEIDAIRNIRRTTLGNYLGIRHVQVFEDIYDENDFVIEANQYYAGMLDKKTKYKLNEYGNPIEENAYNEDGSLWSKKTLIYNHRQEVIEERNFEADGSPSTRWIREYDSYGNQVKSTSYNPNGSINVMFKSKYNSRGKLVEFDTYNSKLELETREIKNYDERDNVIQELAYGKGLKLLRKKDFELDANGYLIKYVWQNSTENTGGK
jgi:hypothetical protein